MRRRTVLSVLAATLGGCVTASPASRTPDPTVGTPVPAGPTVGLDPVLAPDERLRQPTDLAVCAPGEWFVADRSGLVFAYDGTLDSEPVLDLRERVVTDIEQGFHGVTLGPEGECVYVRYSRHADEGTPDWASHESVLSAFDRTGDGIASGSERVLLTLAQPGPEHNGGAVTFGPDGYLYTSFGTGEWVEYPVEELPPGHESDWYERNLGSNAQVVDNLYGSIVRIDPTRAEGNESYAVPDDNPLVGREGCDELYAWGFRNPWRMGFSDDRLVVGDVGEYDVEEVDVVEKGGNYGWNVYEGRRCFDADAPGRPFSTCPARSERNRPLRDPVLSYPHEVHTDAGVRKANFAVVGGYIYDGESVPALDGKYVFGDYGGRLFVATPGGETWPMRELRVADTGNGRPPGQVYAFARDAAGELLVLLVGERAGVYRVVSASGQKSVGPRSQAAASP